MSVHAPGEGTPLFGASSVTGARSAYRPGNTDDFDRLYRESYRRVLVMLLALLKDAAAAEDCAQETFVRAFRAWPRWRPDARPDAWVHSIGVHVALSYRRHERLREAGEVVRRLGRPRVTSDEEPRQPGGELLAALRRLPPQQAVAIVLRHHHGYTNREIAAALGVPESTVASRLAAGRERLRVELDGGRSVPAGRQAGSAYPHSRGRSAV